MQRRRSVLTSCVADDADGESSGQRAKTNRDAAAELQKRRVQGHLLVEAGDHDDAADEAVDGQDLCHDGTESVTLFSKLLLISYYLQRKEP